MEDVTALHLANEQLRRSNELLDTITRLQSRYLEGVDEGELFDGLLEELLATTQSEFGFIAQLLHDDGPYLRTWAVTDISWNEATRARYAEYGPRGMEFRNLDTLYGRVVTGAAPILSNDPAHDPRTSGRPEGHPRLDSFLGVPILRGSDIFGMLAFANRPGGYEPRMAEDLEPLAVTIGSIFGAITAERERDAAEAREQRTATLFRSVVEEATEAIVAVDDEGVITAMNGAGARLVGLAPEEVLASPISCFIPPDRREATFGQALREARDAVERTSLAKDRFLAGMSHELRTPLNSVIGLATVLSRGLHGPLTGQQARYVAQIESSGRHLLAVIDRILDLAKLEAETPELELSVLAVAPLVEESVTMVQEQATSKGITIGVEIPDELPHVRGDRRRTKQILLDLLSNAVEFTPDGGRIGVRAHRAGGMACIALWDTGVGIPEDRLEDIFRPFEQVDSSLAKRHEGIGLGLALSRRLTEMQDGTLTVESTVGRGSVFTITLPIAPGAPKVDGP